MLFVEVIGRYKGAANSYGVVSGKSFDEAVNKAFANRKLYRSVVSEGKNRWRVTGLQGHSREYVFYVWTRRATEQQVSELQAAEQVE